MKLHLFFPFLKKGLLFVLLCSLSIAANAGRITIGTTTGATETEVKVRICNDKNGIDYVCSGQFWPNNFPIPLSTIKSFQLVGSSFGWQNKNNTATGISPLEVAFANTTRETINGIKFIVIKFTKTPRSLPIDGETLVINSITPNKTFWAVPSGFAVIDGTKASPTAKSLLGPLAPAWRMLLLPDGKTTARISYGSNIAPNLVTRVQNPGTYSLHFWTNSGYIPTGGRYGAVHISDITGACFGSQAFPGWIDEVGNSLHCAKNGIRAAKPIDPNNPNAYMTYPDYIEFSGIYPSQDQGNLMITKTDIATSKAINLYVNFGMKGDANFIAGPGLSWVLKNISKTTIPQWARASLNIGAQYVVPSITYNGAQKSVTMQANNAWFIPNIAPDGSNKSPFGTAVTFGVISERNPGGREVTITKNPLTGYFTATLDQSMIVDSDVNASFYVKDSSGNVVWLGNQWKLNGLTRNADYTLNYGVVYKPTMTYLSNGWLAVNFNTNHPVGMGSWIGPNEPICLRSNVNLWTGCAISGLQTIDTKTGWVQVAIYYNPPVNAKFFTLTVERGVVGSATDDSYLNLGSLSNVGYWSNSSMTTLTGLSVSYTDGAYPYLKLP